MGTPLLLRHLELPIQKPRDRRTSTCVSSGRWPGSSTAAHRKRPGGHQQHRTPKRRRPPPRRGSARPDGVQPAGRPQTMPAAAERKARRERNPSGGSRRLGQRGASRRHDAASRLLFSAFMPCSDSGAICWPTSCGRKSLTQANRECPSRVPTTCMERVAVGHPRRVDGRGRRPGVGPHRRRESARAGPSRW